MPLINCEVSLTLTWSVNCVLTDTTKQAAMLMYVPVATFSTENYKTLLEQLRRGFKRTVKWNKYRSDFLVRLIRLKITTSII